ncbi:MAG: rRNA maturation RNase YbeY [Thermodesulfobacteriota bacterium]
MASPRILVTDRARSAMVTVARNILLSAMRELGLEGRELSLLLTLNGEIQELNKRFRGIDKSTDVLSFPMDDDLLLGDIAISMDMVREQALEARCRPEVELARLCHHGLLHLLGYEHIHGGRQAARMRRKEEELFIALKAKGFLSDLAGSHQGSYSQGGE